MLLSRSRARTGIRWIILGLALAGLLAIVPGCKKKDVAGAAAAQAAAEAEANPAIKTEVDISSFGLPLYPDAEPSGGAVDIEQDSGKGYSRQATYRADAPFDEVLAFYRRELAGAQATEVTSSLGRATTLAVQTSDENAVASRSVTIAEAGDQTDITLSASGREARFSVVLEAVDPDHVTAAVDAICEWRGLPEDVKAAQAMKEDAKKLMTVLPRPVEVNLPWGDARTLKEALEAAGGTVSVLPPPGEATATGTPAGA